MFLYSLYTQLTWQSDIDCRASGIVLARKAFFCHKLKLRTGPEIWDLNELVSEGFPTYFFITVLYTKFT